MDFWMKKISLGKKLIHEIFSLLFCSFQTVLNFYLENWFKSSERFIDNFSVSIFLCIDATIILIERVIAES